MASVDLRGKRVKVLISWTMPEAKIETFQGIYSRKTVFGFVISLAEDRELFIGSGINYRLELVK